MGYDSFTFYVVSSWGMALASIYIFLCFLQLKYTEHVICREGINMQQLILKEFFLQRKMFLIYLILPIYEHSKTL